MLSSSNENSVTQLKTKSCNTTSSNDISLPFPIRKSVSYKLINNFNNHEEDDIEIKRFVYESSQESECEESDENQNKVDFLKRFLRVSRRFINLKIC